MTQGSGIIHRTARAATGCAATALLVFTSGCGTGIRAGFASHIEAPTNALRVNQQVQLETESVITGSSMTYWVNGIQGGDATVGTIDSNGLFTAPAITPSPDNTVTITSQANKYPNDPRGSVVISVLNPIPVLDAATPSQFSEGTTVVTVHGSQFVYGAQLVWNGIALPTTFVSGTTLAASIPAPNPGTYPLLVSNPNPGSANSETLAELVKSGQVVLTIQAYNGVSVRVTNSLRIGVGVTGTNNTGINWLINGNPAGNTQIGTIAGNPDGSVTYTAPAVVPTPSNIVRLTAVSVDNPTVAISQNVEVMNPIPVLTNASPMTFDVGQNSVVLTGSKFINGAQLLVNNQAVQTTFNSGGQLTSTFTATDPGNLDFQVLNPSPGPATSADLIAAVNGNLPALLVSPEDASRFLAQATFGATDAEIHRVSKIGLQAWLDSQFSVPQSLEEPTVETALILNNQPCQQGDLKCNAALFTGNNGNGNVLQQSFWRTAMSANDQLRQRAAFSLSEMFVISSTNPAVGNMPRGMAAYYDMLGADAFGNFRTLLEDVTLSPMMGKFLSMLGNDKGGGSRDPDENYAREVMQLFTIGLYQLNPDGTQKLDPMGQPIPTYSNLDVMGLAKVLTGYSWNIPGNASETAWNGCCLYVGNGYGEDLLPMQPFASHHSTEQKDFLGVSLPANGNSDPAGDLKVALDTLFNHPNVPPFFSRQLIQRMVTSNPSPEYVSRVSAVFTDNGAGVRGDLKAVLQAILLDPEARDAAAGARNPQYGKIREPLVRYTEWARAFTAQSRNGVFDMGSSEDPIYGLGEMSLRSPSVFNWFAPGYVPPGTSIAQAGLVAPEFGMTDVSTVVGYLNSMQGSIDADAQNGPDVFSNYGTELGLANDSEALLDRLNLLMMAGSMDATLRSQIIGAVNAIGIPSSSPEAAANAMLARVKTAIYLTMASPAYAAQF